MRGPRFHSSFCEKSCSFCLPAFMMSVEVFVRGNQHPTSDDATHLSYLPCFTPLNSLSALTKLGSSEEVTSFHLKLRVVYLKAHFFKSVRTAVRNPQNLLGGEDDHGGARLTAHKRKSLGSECRMYIGLRKAASNCKFARLPAFWEHGTYSPESCVEICDPLRFSYTTQRLVDLRVVIGAKTKMEKSIIKYHL